MSSHRYFHNFVFYFSYATGGKTFSVSIFLRYVGTNLPTYH
nr:MAG TPA: hypothetical protein [Caudoviricetes sp.]